MYPFMDEFISSSEIWEFQRRIVTIKGEESNGAQYTVEERLDALDLG